MRANGRVGQVHLPFFYFLKPPRPQSVQSSRRAKRKGVGGKEFLPAYPKSKAPPPCSSRVEPSKKVFFSFYPHTKFWCGGLEEKIGGAQIKKCKENFFAGWRAVASGGGAERQFRSKKFRAKFRISHQNWFDEESNPPADSRDRPSPAASYAFLFWRRNALKNGIEMCIHRPWW